MTLGFALLATAAAAVGQEADPGDGSGSQEPAVEPAAASPEAPAGKAAADSEGSGCRLPPGGSWLDWLRRNFYRSACLTALWFDDLFGDERVSTERAGTWGRVHAGASWDERGDLDGVLRLRAKLVLPRLERRLHAVIGRDESERPAGDRFEDSGGIPDAFRVTDEEWLSGLEYEPVRGDRHDLDFGVGVRLSSPVDPYLRLRYRLQQPVAERRLVRWQTSPFWSDSTGAGLASRLDFDVSLRPALLLRLHGTSRITERSHGVEWLAGPVLYQRAGEGRAFAHRVVAESATDGDRSSTVYRLETLVRQRLHREWLVLELQPRLEWRHPSPDEPRELVPGLGIGLEMRFGEHGSGS